MNGQVARLTLAAKQPQKRSTEQPQKRSTDDPSGESIIGGCCLAMFLVFVGLFIVGQRNRAAARQQREQRERAYHEALAALAKDSQNSSLRTAALAAGRAHYGGTRPDGRLTIYDEQAITNDLVAHSGGR